MKDKETLEEAAEKYVNQAYPNYTDAKEKAAAMEDFIAGAKWQAERMYNAEEINQIIDATFFDRFHNRTF